ncbi:MAG TPA: S49 family peptidase [Candidatus Azoamicus sp. OHIO2]
MVECNHITDLVIKNISEKTIKTRLAVFLKTTFFSIGVIFIIFIFNSINITKKWQNNDHIAIIELNGIIDYENSLNAKHVIIKLNNAFFNFYSKVLIIKINSPGGSPVQASLIYNHIKRLRKISNKPIYSVIEDIGTSGAYLIALATEKIYCNPTSLVGSIGVVVASFGYVEMLRKFGIERRVYKSSKYKVLIDPFLETIQDEVDIIQHNINIINKYFINIVKKNRHEKLNENYDVFTGTFWVGRDALMVGLVDGFYDIYTLSYDVIKITNIIYYNNDLSNFFSFFKN